MKDVKIDYIGMFGTQYSAIISCFIFSKVAYAVTIECHAMMGNYRAAVNRGGGDVVVLSRLQGKNAEFQKLSTESMKPHRFWFTVDWISYAVTAFMSIAYLAETIMERLYGFMHHNCNPKCDLGIFLFSLEHTVLFLYPCFRAASILDARNSLIGSVCTVGISPIFQQIQSMCLSST